MRSPFHARLSSLASRLEPAGIRGDGDLGEAETVQLELDLSWSQPARPERQAGDVGGDAGDAPQARFAAEAEAAGPERVDLRLDPGPVAPGRDPRARGHELQLADAFVGRDRVPGEEVEHRGP